MNFNLASRNDYIDYKGSFISLKGLSSININFDKKIINYEVKVDTADQSKFVFESISNRNAIIFDKVLLEDVCHIVIKGQGRFEAKFKEFYYDGRKNKYICIFVQNIIDNTLQIDDQEILKEDILDIS
jgi:predicted nucleic acid-binding protein